MELFTKIIAKKIILTSCLFFLGIAAFSQKEEKNGTIYIKHPYIDVVNKSAKAYLEKDDATNKKIFADTATFWVSGMTKRVKIEEAIKMWNSDFDFYSDIQQTQVGYPDFLHYMDKDQKYVQSWWKWSGKSKKTGEMITVNFVQFDLFNKDGKIANESIYGDFSKMVKE
ncbi:MAG: hypothetical protein GZ087_05875 [Flavobacterium sp.]|nr:hypothetical protein [Flavobacterium sp.]